MTSRRSTRRNPLRVRGEGYISLHPTKGYRRISEKRVRAAAKPPHMIRAWSLAGLPVAVRLI